jgi:hypothetical protein
MIEGLEQEKYILRNKMDYDVSIQGEDKEGNLLSSISHLEIESMAMHNQIVLSPV